MISNRFAAFSAIVVGVGFSIPSPLSPVPGALTPGPSAARGRGGVPADSAVVDTFRVYYVGYPIGFERTTMTRDADGYRLADDYDQTDRGRRNHTASRLRYERDFTPQLIELSRVTDSNTRVETRIDVKDHSATITTRAETTTVALPPVAFAITGAAPTVQRMALVRYWLAHGRPLVLRVVPGGPNEVRIEDRGRDTVAIKGDRAVLQRYSIDGVVWGKDALWLDRSGRLAAFATAGGGGLSLETVRLDVEPSLPQLMARATQDRLLDLGRTSAMVSAVATAAGTGSVALMGATLIDGTGRAAIPNATVVISGGKIIGAGTDVRIPTTARRIDVSGKTIIPGLWEMHGHLMQVEWATVYLAAGVTTARDMGNEIGFIVPFRDAIKSGRAIGPRILLAGLIDGGGPNAFGAVNATTPDEGRAAVQRYHQLGFEQMKLYDLLKPDVVGAITAEAHRLGMTVTGHIPRSLTLLAAVDSGMDHVAHLPIRGDAGSDSVKRIIDSLKVHGTVVDPTASWGEILGHSVAESVATFQPGINHLPPVLYQRISRMGRADTNVTAAHNRLAHTLAIIKALHDAGVPVVAGTDEGVPAFSVYREIELYAQAGFTPMEALRAATAVPAKAMNLDGETGTIEVGKRADLLVLDANPLDNI
ncbi:MAG TPA: amidohydrolase family protein, partial [Gemmatimonadales bacterium]